MVMENYSEEKNKNRARAILANKNDQDYVNQFFFL